MLIQQKPFQNFILLQKQQSRIVCPRTYCNFCDRSNFNIELGRERQDITYYIWIYENYIYMNMNYIWIYENLYMKTWNNELTLYYKDGLYALFLFFFVIFANLCNITVIKLIKINFILGYESKCNFIDHTCICMYLLKIMQ